MPPKTKPISKPKIRPVKKPITDHFIPSHLQILSRNFKTVRLNFFLGLCQIAFLGKVILGAYEEVEKKSLNKDALLGFEICKLVNFALV